MPTAARIALLIVGILLLAAAVIGAAVAAARKNSRRSGLLQRLAIGVVGAALIVWALAQGPRAAQRRAVIASAAAAPVHPDVVFLADSVFDGCVAPSRPAAAPDGTTATRAQMLASQAAAKAFDTATDSYQSCLNKAADDFTRQYGRGISDSNLRAVEALHTRINNAAVDVDQSVADQFNKQLQIFTARPRS